MDRNRQRNSPALTSNGIQAIFEAAECDVLLLYDSCHSVDTAIAPAHSSRGATELIAACGFEGIAAEVGEHSFTNALIDVLVRASSESSFSVSQLHSRVIQQLRNWKPSPMRDETSRFVQDPYGRLLIEPQRRRTPVYCNLVHDSTRKPIILSKIASNPVLGNSPLPLNNGLSLFGPHPQTAGTGSQTIDVENEVSSAQAMDRNHDLIIKVKIIDEVVTGQRVPNCDTWLEWLRNAPPEADQIEIHIVQSTFYQDDNNENESTPRNDQQDDMNSVGGVCSSQSIQVLPSQYHQRGPWAKAEDIYLVHLVHTQELLNWVGIARLMGSRSPKQCRERYHQNLKPTLNQEPITPEEGRQIEELVIVMGERWSEIARRLPGRSENMVKNWWNGTVN